MAYLNTIFTHKSLFVSLERVFFAYLHKQEQSKNREERTGRARARVCSATRRPKRTKGQRRNCNSL